MRKEYEQAYEFMYSNYVPTLSTPSQIPDPVWIRSEIDRSISNIPILIPVRWDAKYFLLVNCDLLILRPIKEAINANPFFLPNVPNIRNDISADIRAILTEAASRKPLEISGHVILESVAAIYSQLNVTKLNVWS